MSRTRNGVYRRPNSRNYFFRVKNEQGEWIERTSGTSDYAEAKKKKTQAEREIEEGCLPNDRSAWTLKTAVEEWLKDRKVRVSAGTYASDLTNTRHLKRIFGEESKLLRLAEVQATKRYQTQRLGEGISPKTINNEVLALSAILQDANLWHRVSSRYRPLKVRRAEVGVALTRDQEVKLLTIAQNSDISAVAPYVTVLALRTGMRMKEIKFLRMSAIRMTSENPHILVHRSTTKTDAGSRHVALDQFAIWALRRLIARACSLGATEPESCLLPTLLDMHTRKNDPLHGRTGYDSDHPILTALASHQKAPTKSSRKLLIEIGNNRPIRVFPQPSGCDTGAVFASKVGQLRPPPRLLTVEPSPKGRPLNTGPVSGTLLLAISSNFFRFSRESLDQIPRP